MGGVALELVPSRRRRVEDKQKKKVERTLVSLSLLSELGEVDGIFTGVGHSVGRKGKKGRKEGEKRVSDVGLDHTSSQTSS